MNTKHMNLGQALVGAVMAAGLVSGVAQAATHHAPYHDHQYEYDNRPLEHRFEGETNPPHQVISNPTEYTRTVNYRCQSGKSLKVTYGFNHQGLPTYAAFRDGGRIQSLPIDLNRSDNVDSEFNSVRGYRLVTDSLNSKNYRQKPIMITAPNQQIVYKGCNPR